MYNADKKKIPSRQMKKLIMSVNDWTEEQYRKQYDLFKNKLRAYENFRRAHGVEVETQSPQELLYKAAKAKKREGADYEPSLAMKRIQSFSAVSITKGRKLAQDLESEYSKRRGAQFAQTTSKAFARFIEDVPKAKEIVYGVPLTENSNPALIEQLTQGKEYKIADGQIYVEGVPLWEKEPVSDPVKREEALKALAEYVHAKQRPTGEMLAGEFYGSGDAGEDFDYSQWLE